MSAASIASAQILLLIVLAGIFRPAVSLQSVSDTLTQVRVYPTVTAFQAIVARRWRLRVRTLDEHIHLNQAQLSPSDPKALGSTQ
jgi:hypothetical protein